MDVIQRFARLSIGCPEFCLLFLFLAEEYLSSSLSTSLYIGDVARLITKLYEEKVREEHGGEIIEAGGSKTSKYNLGDN